VNISQFVFSTNYTSAIRNYIEHLCTFRRFYVLWNTSHLNFKSFKSFSEVHPGSTNLHNNISFWGTSPLQAAYPRQWSLPEDVCPPDALECAWPSVSSLRCTNYRSKLLGPDLQKTSYEVLRQSYDNANVTIDLRRTCNIPRRTRSFSWVQFTCEIVRSSEIVFVNWLAYDIPRKK